MPIQFACPSCARGYRVKDELAGKSAKCGQCGHKMKIPSTANAMPHAAAAQPPAPKSAALKTAAVKAISPGPAAAKAVAATANKVANKVASTESQPADPGMSSWLDEELESARVEAKSKPKPPPAGAGCPSCNGPMAPGALVCVKCGYDTRIRGRRSVERVTEDDSTKKRSKLGSAASLLRGTFFSFLGAMLGAFVWAVLAYLTMYEFSIVAWGLGGLAGLGMALGHEADDGTFAGIIAAFMSFVGIVAAKIFIVIIVVAAALSSAVNDLKFDVDADPVEMQRTALAYALTMKELAGMDESGNDEVDEARWEAALAKSQAAVADLTPEEIEARLNELGEEHGLDGEVEGFDDDEADDVELAEDDAEAIDEEALAAEEAEAAADDVSFGSVIGSLFGPIDGLFILLAFFTAYKVGSGEATD
jgi:hypothetical protein